MKNTCDINTPRYADKALSRAFFEIRCEAKTVDALILKAAGLFELIARIEFEVQVSSRQNMKSVEDGAHRPSKRGRSCEPQLAQQGKKRRTKSEDGRIR